MSEMFLACYKLKHLNIRNFKFDKVENMSHMFYDCKNLSKLDIIRFTMNKLIEFGQGTNSMFTNCDLLSQSLKSKIKQYE